DIVGWSKYVTPGFTAPTPCSYDANGKVKTREYALTAAYTLGAFTPKFTYAHCDKREAAGVKIDDSGYNQHVLGVDYANSKRNTFGAQYGVFDVKGGVNNANKDLKALGLNMIHAF
ncbi:porin, partial [Pseudomonas sp. MWU13-2860]